jgi:hypothetical protein
MTSIFDGVRKNLESSFTERRINSDMLNDAMNQIEKNWHGNGTSSKKNWDLRFVSLPQDTSKQKNGHGLKAEVPLERTIAKAFEGKGVVWNQMPVASGLIDKPEDKLNSAGKRRAVDLIYKSDETKKTYELIELKVAGNNKDDPISSAFEVIEYGLMYLFSRGHLEQLGYSTDRQPILSASNIGLRVLAEMDYYKKFNYDGNFPVNDLNIAFKGYIDGNEIELGELKMDFQFESFPDEFKCPEIDSSSVNEAILESLRNAFLNKKAYSIYQTR